MIELNAVNFSGEDVGRVITSDDLKLIRGSLIKHQADLIKLSDEIILESALEQIERRITRCEELVQLFRDLEV